MPADTHAKSVPIRTIDDLRQYIHTTICHRERLKTDCFPLTEQTLRQAGIKCGILFCLHGPRQVMLTAVWDARRQTVFFYSSSGERFQTTRLRASQSLDQNWREPA
jgi:hypothetical protein